MENSSVTVYGKPNCMQCDMTEKYLKRANVPYNKIDITEDDVAYDYITGLGYLQAPVVDTGSDHWSGFIPARLATLS